MLVEIFGSVESLLPAEKLIFIQIKLFEESIPLRILLAGALDILCLVDVA